MSTAEQALSVKSQVSEEEWQTRVNLAACYRLIAMYGWDDLIFTHISARVPGPDDHFLINAYGLLFEEMTASIGEIAKNAEHSSTVANSAAQLAQSSNDNIGKLGVAADEIGKVIETEAD